MYEPGEGIVARVMKEGERHYLVLPHMGGAVMRTDRDVIIAITKEQREGLGVPDAGMSVRGRLQLVPEGVHDEIGVLSGVERKSSNGHL